ncbi:MAG: hypothetical protein IPN71_01300 [Fibrobacteres bacterium]|nr:hypothetical protein [Fibrobacterota bacterium]
MSNSLAQCICVALYLLPLFLWQSESFAANSQTLSNQDSAWQSLSSEFESLAQLESPSGRYSALWRLQQHGKIFRRACTLLGDSQKPFGKELIKSHLSPCRSLSSTCKILLHSNPLSKESSRLLQSACPTCRFAESDSSVWTIFHSTVENGVIKDDSFRDELVKSSLKLTTSFDQIDTSILRIYFHLTSETINKPKYADFHSNFERIIKSSGLANGFSHLLPPGIIIKGMNSDSLQALLNNHCPACTTYSVGGLQSIFPSNRWWSRNLDPISYQRFLAYQKIIIRSPEDLSHDLTESCFSLENGYPYTPAFYTAYFPLTGSINGLLKKRYRAIYKSNHQDPCKNPAFTKFAREYIKRGRDQNFKRSLKTILCE